ncbi:hypothetical protein LINGRAPRIM_LOCUS2853, partial [Linum grandiflorum]
PDVYSPKIVLERRGRGRNNEKSNEFKNLKSQPNRIFQSQPWAFKSSIINLIPWEAPSQDLFDRLDFMPLTIPLKDLPSSLNTIKFGSKLLEPLGSVISTNIYSSWPGEQKPRYHKPLPYVFHSYVTVEQTSSPIPSSDALGSSSTVTVLTAPLISGMPNSHTLSGFHCYVLLFSWSLQVSMVHHNIPYPRRHHPPFKLLDSILQQSFCFSYADPLLGNCFVVSVLLILPDMERKRIRAISDFLLYDTNLHDMQLADKKRARDDEEAGASSSNTKRIKLPPLQISDFPEVGMDLEMLPNDLLDFDPEMIAVTAALSSSMGEEATPLRPQGQE